MVTSSICSEKEKLYTIGQVAKKCGVSRKTLRFYEELGIIKPDVVCPETSYRYYNKDTMMLLPIIKYYKQMGFKLQEMTGVGKKGTCFYHETNFITKIEELTVEEQEIRNRHVAVEDWLNMIREGTMVVENRIQQVSVKFVDKKDFYFKEQEFTYDYKDAVINVPWVNYLEKNNVVITGAVYLGFSSYQEKFEGKIKKASIMQEPIGIINPSLPRWQFGGDMMACVYHIGPHETIDESYEKIIHWAQKNKYICGPECYERYIVDYWATQDTDDFVTEIMLPIKK